MAERKLDIIEGVESCAGEMQAAFPIGEYRNRLTAIRKVMDREKVDMLYVTSPESMNYVSGYDVVWHRVNSPRAWFDSIAAGMAIHVDHDRFIHYDLPDEEGPIKCTSVCTDTRIFYDIPGEMYGKQYVSPSGDKDYVDLVFDDLVSEKWLKGRVALELGSYRPNAVVFQRIRELAEKAGCEVVDGTDIIREVRGIKSPLEMQYIQTATRITDLGMKTIKETLRPGMTELQVVAEYTKAMYDAGGEYPAILNMVRSGPQRCWGFHYPASRRMIMHGDPVGVDLAGVYNRYHSNQCRYFCVGEPSEEFLSMYSVNVDIMNLVRETIKPNLTVAAFLRRLKEFYIEKGLWGKQYWIGGYELGIAYPPDWVGHFVYDIYSDCDDESRRFVPGTVVNFETGFGVIDTLMFTETEAKILGTTPWELQIVSV